MPLPVYIWMEGSQDWEQYKILWNKQVGWCSVIVRWWGCAHLSTAQSEHCFIICSISMPRYIQHQGLATSSRNGREEKKGNGSQRILQQTSKLSFAHMWTDMTFKNLDIQGMHLHLILTSISPCLSYLHIRQITLIRFKIRVNCAIKAVLVSES